MLARLPALWEPRWSLDEGRLAAVAAGMLQGRRLYVQVWDDQQPLAYAWMAGAMAVTRGWHPGMQMVLAGQVLVATLFVYLIAERLGGRAGPSALLFGLACALPLLEGDLQGPEMIGLPALLAGLWLGVSGGAYRALAGGALVTLAAAADPAYALEGLALAWFAAAAGRPLRLLPIVAGAAAAAVVLWLALVAGGAWPAYGGVLASEQQVLGWANGGRELAPITLVLRLLPIGAALLAGLRLGIEQETPASRLLGAWLPLAVAAAVLDPRGFMHFGLLVLAPLCLLAGLWLSWRLFAPVLVGVVFLVQALLYLPRAEMFVAGPWPLPRFQYATFGWDRMPSYYRSWYDRVVGVTDYGAYAESFPGHADQVERLGAGIKVEGSLAVWGDQPWLYVDTGRRPAGRFVSHDQAWRLQPGAEKESVEAIRASRPEYVVVLDRTPAALNRLLAKEYDRLTFIPPPGKTYGLHSG